MLMWGPPRGRRRVTPPRKGRSPFRGGVNYSSGRGIGGTGHAKEIRGPHTGPYGRTGRARERARVRGDEQHGGPPSGASYCCQAGIPRNRTVDRRPSARLHGGRVSRVCVRPDGGEKVAASSTTSGLVPEPRESPVTGSDVDDSAARSTG